MRFLSGALILIFCLSGCYSVRFEKSVSALEPVHLRQHMFVFGLIGTGQVDLSQECPRGAAGFSERFTLGDIIYTLASVGIYSPKSVFVSCET